MRGGHRPRYYSMRLLLIYGELDAGKSTTCLRLHKMLKGIDAIVDFYERFPWGDFKSVLKLHGTKIAIYSAGDEKQHLQNAIDFGNSQACDLLVAVVRTGTHYNETLADLTRGEDFEWFTLVKGINTDEVSLNETRMVIQLFNEIVKAAGL